ncbi:MAG: sulfatase, partial [Planctomycetaceae bacterium]|nr:sulfatase [Planctomycetaceae bacterium]
LAGGGVRGGMRNGKTDDFGYYVAQDKVSIPDLHATILHLLGLDHERLTFRHAGRDFRLTDVEGEVVREILS